MHGMTTGSPSSDGGTGGGGTERGGAGRGGKAGIGRATRLLTTLAVAALAAGSTASTSSAQEASGGARDTAGAHQHSSGQPREATSPFTGLPAEPAPVLAVKIDNHKDARPHTALEDADITVVEKVEGGLSRLLGIYSSKLPDSLGPVRSARAYNVEQLRMFDRPALSYSGARKGVEDLIEKSTLHARSHDKYPAPYIRGGDNEAPHNLYVHPDELLDTAPEASKSADIGFRFADDAPEGGEPTAQRSVDYGSAETTFDWSKKEDRWLTSFDGAPATSTGGARLGGKTVVVQKVEMPPDDAGTPYEKTVGSGKATVLRDGKAYETTWERPKAESGTTFTLPNGERMPFDRGNVWIVYEEA
ncbi:DUF3048 domain-containing protein [Streptomyces winkii]|uniref:DUF3048 domain-containing protein n=1 Tax=Streptomyces winkii TaxID=3051178 RepID=UPI0028D66B14|nr:DUF3048 domain-containing protein [Streptomyces sp. DSM 40971]